jgi:hypothetical protein
MLLQSTNFLLAVINPLTVLIMLIFAVIKLYQTFKVNINNIYIALMFFSIVAGIAVQLVYFSLSDQLSDEQYIMLGRLSGAILMFGISFPLFFQMGVMKGFAGLPKSFKIGYFVGFGLLSILNLIIGNVQLIENRGFLFDLVWVIYNISVVSAILLATIISAITILKHFTQTKFKRKFWMFIAGFIIILLVFADIVLMSGGIMPRAYAVYINSIGMFIGSILLYLGIVFRK